jgi:hypothetical protein
MNWDAYKRSKRQTLKQKLQLFPLAGSLQAQFFSLISFHCHMSDSHSSGGGQERKHGEGQAVRNRNRNKGDGGNGGGNDKVHNHICGVVLGASIFAENRIHFFVSGGALLSTRFFIVCPSLG